MAGEVDRITENREFGAFAMLRARGASRLVVGFSPANTESGKFGFYSSLHVATNDSLLLNVPQNDWYANGVPLHGRAEPSFAQTVGFIRDVASGYDEVVFLGGSMGGVCGAALRRRVSRNAHPRHGARDISRAGAGIFPEAGYPSHTAELVVPLL